MQDKGKDFITYVYVLLQNNYFNLKPQMRYTVHTPKTKLYICKKSSKGDNNYIFLFTDFLYSCKHHSGRQTPVQIYKYTNQVAPTYRHTARISFSPAKFLFLCTYINTLIGQHKTTRGVKIDF